MYDELMCFYLFGLDSGFSQSGDIDELAMEVNMEGSRIDTNFEGSGFAQHLERVLLSFFVGIVYMCGEGMGLCFFYYSMP